MSQQNQNMNRTIKTIRTVGVIALLLSGFVFLMQGYMDWDGFERFLAFTGVNAVVAGVGLFCAKIWKEPKGARTMLAISGAGVAAQFAQLGGMIYNFYHRWAHQGVELYRQSEIELFTHEKVPEIFAKFHVGGWKLPMAIGLLAVIAPLVMKLCFRVMAQGQDKNFLKLFFFNALFLLLPFRMTYIVVLNVILVGAALYAMYKNGQLNFQRGYTFEKWMALAISLTPMVINIGRDSFYMTSIHGFIALIFILIAMVMYFVDEYRYKAPVAEDGRVVAKRRSYNGMFFNLAVASAFVMGDLLGHLSLALIYDAFILSMVTLVGFGELTKRGLVSIQTNQVVNLLAVGVFGYAQVFIKGGMEPALLFFTIGVVSVLYGFYNRDKRSFNVSVVAMLIALVEMAHYGLSFDFIFSWINLAVIGIVTVLAASLMEKKSNEIKKIHADFMKHF